MINCWAIWKFRNDMVFNNGDFRNKTIKELIVDISFDWFVNRNRKVLTVKLVSKLYVIFVIC